MSNSWKAGFKRALVDAIIRNGSPLDPKADIWGWTHPKHHEVAQAVRSGKIDYQACTWEESEWSEFMGSFYEGDTRKYGMDLTIKMKDGQEFIYRYSGTVSDLILAVVADV